MVSRFRVRDSSGFTTRVIADLMGSGPTALDAAAFAYLHVLLHAEDDLRIEVARRVNLIHWERRVHEQVCAAFVPYRST
jgi:Glutathione S-transferase, C-terminal domain